MKIGRVKSKDEVPTLCATGNAESSLDKTPISYLFLSSLWHRMEGKEGVETNLSQEEREIAMNKCRRCGKPCSNKAKRCRRCYYIMHIIRAQLLYL
jgi:hypothetical protein